MPHDSLYVPWAEAELKEFNWQKGVNTETRFMRAWRRGWRNRRHYQQWLHEVVLSDFDDDVAGIDAFLVTNIKGFEKIPVQIKSSEAGIRKHKAIYRNIPVLAIRYYDTNLNIRQKTIQAILEIHPNLALVMHRAGTPVSPYTLAALNLSI